MNNFQNATSRPTIKRCECCLKYYSAEAFARDNTRPLGSPKLQSWCRRCKVDWERGPHGAWKRFAAFMRDEEPASLERWTEELYVAGWAKAGGECEGCGARLDEWQWSGHRLDRIDNRRPHVPGNCRFLCWPCNRDKGDKPAAAWASEIESLVAKWGRGKVPWAELRTWARPHDALPDLSAYEVEPQLFLPIAR